MVWGKDEYFSAWRRDAVEDAWFADIPAISSWPMTVRKHGTK
jgi:hypothetical protein